MRTLFHCRFEISRFLRTILVTSKEKVGIDVKTNQFMVERDLDYNTFTPYSRSGLRRLWADYSARTHVFIPSGQGGGLTLDKACLVEIVEVFALRMSRLNNVRCTPEVTRETVFAFQYVGGWVEPTAETA